MWVELYGVLAYSVTGTGRELSGYRYSYISHFLLSLSYHRMWRAPLSLDQLLSGTWLADRTTTFSVDYEIWMHGEAALCMIDLGLASCATVISTVASHAHLIAHQSSRFWHAVLQNTDWLQKLWTMLLRELLEILTNTLVLSLLWDSRLDHGVLVVTGIYISRLMSNMEALHTVSLDGIVGQFQCWSRCVIRTLPLPTEAAFVAWNDKCSVCQLEELQRTQLCIFPCGHFFHRECIEEWLKRRMCCPLCMRRIWFENDEVKIDK